MRRAHFLSAVAAAWLAAAAQAEPIVLIVSGNGGNAKGYDASWQPTGDATPDQGAPGAVGIAFGPGGDIFLSRASHHSVYRFDANGNFVSEFVTAGLGGLNTPQNLTFGPDGNLYVASRGTNTVKRYDPTGAYLGDFASDDLSAPTDLKFGPDGRLWVSNFDSGKINRYSAVTGDKISTFAQMVSPRGFDFLANGDVAVYDFYAERLRRYNSAGSELLYYSYAYAYGGVAVGPDGNIYMTDNNGTLSFDGVTTDFLGYVTGPINEPRFLAFVEAPVPEPGTWLMMSLGLGAVAVAVRRRQRDSLRNR